MKKCVDFKTYKQFQKLSFNDTNRLFSAIYANAFEDGQIAFKQDIEAAITEDRLMEIILSVKGVGKNRAEQIVKLILEEGLKYYGTEA